MSGEKLASATELEFHVHERITELIRSNEALREDVRQLREEKTGLERRLAQALSSRHTDRESRRAALNLMEDAMIARRAEERVNTELQRIEEELRTADRRKDEFLATLAHELRNPLAPIRNILEVLRLTEADANTVKRFHEMMERQVNHLVRLVEDLMDVSRIARGIIELRKECVDISSVVCSAVEASTPQIEAAKHRLVLSLPSEPLILEADPVRLAQIVGNLLTNAAKYTEDGGQIWLTVEREGTDAVMSVRDTGLGIPADMLPTVFEPFTQINRTLGRAQGGLGIGLSLVHRLVKMHGGSVEVRSDGPDRGSEFVVRLPLAPGNADEHVADGREDLQAALDSHRILVVDDNHDAADTLAQLLKSLGAEVQTAYDGPAALNALLVHQPSVAILDIGMPDMDGNDVARLARRQPECRDMTLIALTGWGQDADRRKTREAGFDYHLVKPLKLGALQAILASVNKV